MLQPELCRPLTAPTFSAVSHRDSVHFVTKSYSVILVHLSVKHMRIWWGG